MKRLILVIWLILIALNAFSYNYNRRRQRRIEPLYKYYKLLQKNSQQQSVESASAPVSVITLPDILRLSLLNVYSDDRWTLSLYNKYDLFNGEYVEGGFKIKFKMGGK